MISSDRFSPFDLNDGIPLMPIPASYPKNTLIPAHGPYSKEIVTTIIASGSKAPSSSKNKMATPSMHTLPTDPPPILQSSVTHSDGSVIGGSNTPHQDAVDKFSTSLLSSSLEDSELDM